MGSGAKPHKILNLVHIKASGGINFNEFPEKLLHALSNEKLSRVYYTRESFSMKLRNNKRNINHKCNMQSVAKKWDGKMYYEPSHF